MNNRIIIALIAFCFSSIHAQHHLNITGGHFKVTNGCSLVLKNTNWTNNSGGSLTIDGRVIITGTNSGISIGGNSSNVFHQLVIDNPNNIFLTQDLSIQQELEFLNGKLDLQNSDLVLNGIIQNFNSNRYVKTSSGGSLIQSLDNTNEKLYPIGNSSYNPMVVQDPNSSGNDLGIRVSDEVLTNGNSGPAFTTDAVDRSWHISGTAGHFSDILVRAEWRSEDELPGFLENAAYLAKNENSTWDLVPVTPYSGSDPFTMERTGVVIPAVYALRNGDITPPNTICQNITVYLDENGNAGIDPMDVDNGSTDEHGIINYELDFSEFNCDELGPNVVLLTTTDVVNNMSSCMATVTVVDNLAPSITCPDDIVVVTQANECSVSSSEINLGSPTATDNCQVQYPFTNNAPSEYPIGITNVKWIVSDQSNNKNNCKQKVIVQAFSCGQPIQVYHSDTTQTTAKINWLASACATNYQLRIRQEISPGVWGGWSSWANYNGTGLNHIFSNLIPGKYHHYQIRSKCGTSNSITINGWFWTLSNNSLKKTEIDHQINFSDLLAQEQELNRGEVSSKLDLQIMPNPTADLAKIKLDGFESGTKQMILLDLHGKQIFNLTLTQNENLVELNRKILNLKAGLYVVRVRNQNMQIARQLILID